MAPQSYEPTFFLLKRRLPASESANLLGRVVRQYQDPTLSYTPESPSESLTAETFKAFLLGVQYDTDALLRTQASRNDGFWATLSGLLSFSSGSAEGGSTTMKSPRIITRRLKLEKDYFNALKAIPQVRRKILEMCPVGDKVYLIVGTMSVQSAEFKLAIAQRKSTVASGSLPLGVAASAAALSAGGVTLPPDAIPEPEAGTKRSDSSGWAVSFSSTATREDGSSGEDTEEVFAVACKEITRSWRGLGHDVQVKVKHPEYRGGQHFGGGEDSDSDDEGVADETMEALAAEGLDLLETEPARSSNGLCIHNPWR